MKHFKFSVPSLRHLLPLGSVGLIFLATNPVWAQKEVTVIEKKSKVATYHPPAAGSILLACNVPDADIFINNRPSGKAANSKFSQKLQPGKYKVEVRSAEYTSFTRDVTIAAGRAEAIIAELKPNFAMLSLPNVKTKPGVKLAVEVDKQVLPETSYALNGTTLEVKVSPPGTHAIHIKQGARILYNSTVTLDAASTKVEVAEPAKAVLKIESVPTAKVYADDVYCGDVSGDGTLVIDKLSPEETHRVRVEADRFRTYETDLTLSTETDTLVKAKLEAIIEFADNFANLYKWDAPPGWAVETQLLKVTGTNTVGLTKDVGFRGAEVNFELRMKQGGRASWVLRAKDEKNYYLFSLLAVTATSAQFETYICRDGNLGTPVQTDIIPVPLDGTKWSHFRITMKGNKISHFVTPSESPDESSISLFQDRDNLFPYGTVGFASLKGEEFYVGGFVVCPDEANCHPEIKAK
jgi:hypothetical protein